MFIVPQLSSCAAPHNLVSPRHCLGTATPVALSIPPLLVQLAAALTDICDINDQQLTLDRILRAKHSPNLALFSRVPQSFPLLWYLNRIYTLTKSSISPASFVVALIYIGKLTYLAETNADEEVPLIPTSYSVHRLFITCLLIAHKYLDDITYKNSAWAEYCGIQTIQEMNNMEAVVLKNLNYDVSVHEEEFQQFARMLGSRGGSKTFHAEFF